MKNSEIYLYADDTKLFKNIKNININDCVYMKLGRTISEEFKYNRVEEMRESEKRRIWE